MKYKKKIEYVKRRSWTEDEKEEVLKSCSGVCARCGKKLTLETMTMDHVVPRSKGGENVLDNLVALCFDCNHNKANMLCLPSAYYMGIRKLPKIKPIEDYVIDWMNKYITLDYVKEYPLIFNKFTYSWNINGIDPDRKNKRGFAHNNTAEVIELNQDTALGYMMHLGISYEDIEATVPFKNEYYSVYISKAANSDTIYSMFTVQYYKKFIFIGEVISCNRVSTNAFLQAVAINFMDLFYSNIDGYGVSFRNDKSIKDFIGIMQEVALSVGFILEMDTKCEVNIKMSEYWKSGNTIYYVPISLRDAYTLYKNELEKSKQGD